MKISDLIEMLEQEKRIHGDLKVHIQATEIGEDGDVVAGGGYYDRPYEIKTWRHTTELIVSFDKVVIVDD